MFLRSLHVESDGKIIREVHFKLGLNLIIDEETKSSSESGNNVGKTTLLRLVDYCLGASMNSIYTDSETGTINQEVSDLLNDDSTSISLVLAPNWEFSENDIQITRGPFKEYFINGELYIADEYTKELSKLLFSLVGNKPSFRNVTKKFIRINADQSENIYKILGPHAKDLEYEALYLFLFGYQDLSVLSDIGTSSKELQKLKKKLSGLKHKTTKGLLKQAVKINERKVKELQKQKSNFDFGEVVEVEMKSLKDVRSSVSNLTVELSKLNSRMAILDNTIHSLMKSKESFDVTSLRSIYDQAKAELPSLSKKFEDLVVFHNKMIENKISFSQKSFVELEKNLEKKNIELKELLTIEQGLMTQISNKGVLEDYEKINRAIDNLLVEVAGKTAILEQMELIEADILAETEKMSEYRNAVSEYEERLDNSLEIFNGFFSTFSSVLYGEDYAFAQNYEKKIYKFYVSEISGSVGTGKKKGQILCFDLAYLKYLEYKQSNICKFQLYDRLEDVHQNQLKTVFDLINSIRGQFIVPILREKIASLGDPFINQNRILSLSQNDRFFKV